MNIQLFVILSALPIRVYCASFDCQPGQTCWPSSDEWQSFNQTINGRLHITLPYAKPCYDDINSAECHTVQADYVGDYTRNQIYGARQSINWETCGTQSCVLNSTEPHNPINSQCSLGRLSAYYVEVLEAKDVQATLKFTKAHNIRISIKNSGHDYLGRSTTANSLALWTFNLKNLEYHVKFAPSGCDLYENIGVISAGVSAREAYTFFDQYNMHITVGSLDGVGVAGGFGQVGGHGPLGAAYGLMVDQIIELDVITAAGTALTINANWYSDLFWALRGGGGGTYAVVLATKFKLHSAKPLNVYQIRATLNTPASDVTTSPFHKDVVTAIASNSSLWADNNIAGFNFIAPASFQAVRVVPDGDAQKFKDTIAPFASLLETYPGLTIAAAEYATLDSISDYMAYTSPFLSNVRFGIGILQSSRLIPRTQFTSPDSIATLVSSFLSGVQKSALGGGGGLGHIYQTAPVNTPDADGHTSAHPAWRSSLWHTVYPGGYVATTPQASQDFVGRTLASAVQGLKDLTPGGGCYANEADVKEEEWKATFWGPNYEKLLAVKWKYDPENVFNCFKCVGWNGMSDLMYSCYDPSNNPIATFPVDSSS